MATNQELVTELEQSIGGLEKKLDELLAKQDEGNEGGKITRVRLSKAKKDDSEDMADEMDPTDNEDEEDKMDQVKKALAKADAVKKAAAEVEAKKAAAANDETITIAGQTIAKSVVGAAQFAIIKSQSEEITKAKEDIAKERDLREMAELRKRADDSYPHVPGTTDERALMLKALAPLDEKVRKSFEAVLTQSEKLAKAAFEMVGSNGGKDNANGQTFEKKISEIRKRDNSTRTEALAKARDEHPDDFAAYQAEGLQIAAKSGN